ncbi:hypothetical protein A7A76_17040 [Lysobacter enzymogenes]|uniref:FG-GAP repeat domain-containing protein n=1 Tax=Lysobacter enzymogenes TaxID=69 RepID=UPI0019CF4E1F|nr:VCBS repeat-containing protein [Lysobacter enzymogenes]MBN7136454.1 hypothetical protein [Lysobacter enzymogenes]
MRTLPAHAELIAGKPGARLVFSGDGHGGFAETESTVTGAELAGDTLTAHSIAVGDFNGDGRPDVALSLEPVTRPVATGAWSRPATSAATRAWT